VTDNQSERRRDRWILAMILMVVGLVYARAMSNGFTYDDRQYVAAYTMRGPNVMIVEDRDWTEYFHRPMGYGVQEHARGFRPLTVLSYALTHKISRAEIRPARVHPEYAENRIMQEWSDPAWPHHWINLILHLVATWIVYALARRFIGSGLGACAAAAVFGLHALHSDQVIAIVGRGELLPFVFGGSGTLLYLAELERAKGRSWGRIACAGLCMVVAFLSKESAVAWVVMTPLVAATLHVANGETWSRSARRQAVPWSVAVVVPAVLFFVLRARMMALSPEAQGFAVGTDNNPLFDLSLLERLPTAVMVWGYGLWKVFVPYPLSSDYGRAVFDVIGYGDWRFWSAAAALASLLALGLVCRRRAPLVFLGVAAFLGFGFITSNIPVPIETIFGERLYYTPAWLLSCVVACLIGCYRGRGRGVALAVALAWLAVSAVIVVGRTADWASNETLFEADAESQPRSMGLQMNMARVSRLAEDWDRRERFLARALAIDPDYHPALNDRALDLVAERRYAEALPMFLHAVRGLAENPFEYRSAGPDVLTNLATLQQRLRQFGAARKNYAEVVDLGAESPTRSRALHDAYLGLMWLAWRRQDIAEVRRVRELLEGRFPGDTEAKIYDGALALASADAPSAIAVLEPVLASLPESAHTILGHEVIIAALRRTGGVDRAMEHVLRRAQSLHRHHMDREALEGFEAASRVPALQLAAYRGRLWSTWETAGPREVDALLGEALQLAPNDGELAAHRGLLAFAGGDARAAASILSQVAPRLERSRDALRVWLTLGDALLRVGNRPGAAAIADRFLGTRGIPPDYKKAFKNLRARIGASDAQK
jgi:tetratricopeptide (TPR) repeat protein